jgi:hypothetical protein
VGIQHERDMFERGSSLQIHCNMKWHPVFLWHSPAQLLTCKGTTSRPQSREPSLPPAVQSCADTCRGGAQRDIVVAQSWWSTWRHCGCSVVVEHRETLWLLSRGGAHGDIVVAQSWWSTQRHCGCSVVVEHMETLWLLSRGGAQRDIVVAQWRDAW